MTKFFTNKTNLQIQSLMKILLRSFETICSFALIFISLNLWPENTN